MSAQFSERALKNCKEHLYLVSATKSCKCQKPAPWAWRNLEILMLCRPGTKAPFSARCVHVLLLPFEGHTTPGLPAQLSYLSLSQTHTYWKASYRSRLPPGTSSGGLMAKNNFPFLQANCTLVLPKKSSQGTAPSCWLLCTSYFPFLFSPNT